MKSTTTTIERYYHVAIHGLAALVASALITPLTQPVIFGAMVGAYLPDLDAEIELPHRTVTHSVFAVCIMLVTAYASNPADDVWMGVIAGYVSHLLIDLFHGNGIMLLYPMRSMFQIASVPKEQITIALVVMFAVSYQMTAPPIVFSLPQSKQAHSSTPTILFMETTPTAKFGYGRAEVWNCSSTALPSRLRSACDLPTITPAGTAGINCYASAAALPAWVRLSECFDVPTATPRHPPKNIPPNCIYNPNGYTECTETKRGG